jgi:hypothetical protein
MLQNVRTEHDSRHGQNEHDENCFFSERHHFLASTFDNPYLAIMQPVGRDL